MNLRLTLCWHFRAGDHLTGRLRAAGFGNISSRRFRIPFGKALVDGGGCCADGMRATFTAMGAIRALKIP